MNPAAIIKAAPWLIVAALALAVWHYRGAADDNQREAEQQQHRAETAEQANDTLATANAALNARNTTLVESLNARSDQLAAAQRRADANRAAYRQALADNRDWAAGRVPAAVSRELCAATHCDSHNTSAADKGSR